MHGASTGLSHNRTSHNVSYCRPPRPRYIQRQRRKVRVMPMKMLKTAALALALSVTFAGAASAQGVEKKDLTLGVGGKGLLYYLQLTLTERLGHFKEQGLNVTITDFGG